MKELCKCCGKPLEWAETYETEVGFEKGYIIEKQIWSCEHCNKDYIIEKQGYIKDVDIITFEEA